MKMNVQAKFVFMWMVSHEELFWQEGKKPLIKSSFIVSEIWG